jgi:hypothetical protein
MDHRKIAVRVPVMNEVKFLFPSEPCKSLKPRSLYVVFLVEKDVRVKRRRTCDCLSHEEIDWQYEICTRSYQNYRNKEEGRIVAFVTEVGPWEQMIFGIIGVVEVDVVAKELTANSMVAELVMHQRLRKWHDQMRSDGGYEKWQKLRKEPRYRLEHDRFPRVPSQNFIHWRNLGDFRPKGAGNQ